MLLPIHKDTKVSFYCIVLPFCLSIYLRMKCNRESLLDDKEITKWKPELRCKNRFSITDNKVQEALILYYHVNNYFRQSWSINVDFDCFIIYYLSQTINYDKNRVITVAFLVNKQWQPSHKVYWEIFPTICLHQQWLWVLIGLIKDNFRG